MPISPQKKTKVMYSTYCHNTNPLKRDIVTNSHARRGSAAVRVLCVIPFVINKTLPIAFVGTLTESCKCRRRLALIMVWLAAVLKYSKQIKLKL